MGIFKEIAGKEQRDDRHDEEDEQDNVGADMTVTILTVALSLPWAGYVGVYAEHEHCRAMQALIAEEQPQAVMRLSDSALAERR